MSTTYLENSVLELCNNMFIVIGIVCQSDLVTFMFLCGQFSSV